MIESQNLRTPAERIAAAMTVVGIQSATELATRSGLKDARVRSYVNGHRKLTKEAAEALARPLNCDASWLLFGNGRAAAQLSESAAPYLPGPREELPERNFSLAVTPPRPDFQHTIEVKGTAQGGSDGRFYFNGETVERVARPPGLAHRMSVYCIRIDGDSMSPIFEDGELLFVDAARKPFVDRDAVIELHAEEEGEPYPAFVKRIVRVSTEWVELKEWQPKERTFKIPRKKIRSMHLVLRNTEMY